MGSKGPSNFFFKAIISYANFPELMVSYIHVHVYLPKKHNLSKNTTFQMLPPQIML